MIFHNMLQKNKILWPKLSVNFDINIPSECRKAQDYSMSLAL